jgi:thiamine-phosphate pyrophosphorylase
MQKTMPLDLPKPIIYLITSGATTKTTTPESSDFARVLTLVEAAVAAQIPLLQLREKHLSARVLYELATRAAKIARGTGTRLLVNDRSDIACAAGAAGVHLTSGSLTADVVRNTYGSEMLIGVSTHSLEQARAARDAGGDFVVFGPIFETESKRVFGEPLGLRKLNEVARELDGFSVVAIGGVTAGNVVECFRAGASGVAAIRLLNDAENLRPRVEEIRDRYKCSQSHG